MNESWNSVKFDKDTNLVQIFSFTTYIFRSISLHFYQTEKLRKKYFRKSYNKKRRKGNKNMSKNSKISSKSITNKRNLWYKSNSNFRRRKRFFRNKRNRKRKSRKIKR